LSINQERIMKQWTVPVLISLCSLCFGLLFVGIFVNATELDCSRQADGTYACHKRTLFLGQWQISEREFDGVVDIIVAEDCDEGCSYRAEFVTESGGYVPLNTVYTNRGPVSRQVEEIGSQLDRGARTVTYKVNPPWWVLILVGGLTVMGVGLSLLFARRTRSSPG